MPSEPLPFISLVFLIADPGVHRGKPLTLATHANPLIGRLGPADKRELVIGKESQGYVALCNYPAELDTVFVLAICSQREAGYAGF
jgi:hypothetical protein